VIDVCPPVDGAFCYESYACDSSVRCLHLQVGPGGVACDPTADYRRVYYGRTREKCNVIDYDYPLGSWAFGAVCGCGCEQPPECPIAVECAMPRPAGASGVPDIPSEPPPPPLDPCWDPSVCPFTKRTTY
jgi:hypothetical protein